MSEVTMVNSQMYMALEMLKKSGQIQEQLADKLINQSLNNVKVNIAEKLSGSSENAIDIRA